MSIRSVTPCARCAARANASRSPGRAHARRGPRLSRSAVSGAELPDGLGRRVHAHSDGNPLFVTAVVDHMLARGWFSTRRPVVVRCDAGAAGPRRARRRARHGRAADRGPGPRRSPSARGRQRRRPRLHRAGPRRGLARPGRGRRGERRLAGARRALPALRRRSARRPRWPSRTSCIARRCIRHPAGPPTAPASARRPGARNRGRRTRHRAVAGVGAATSSAAARRAALRYLAMAAARARHRLAPREAGQYLEDALALVQRLPDAADRRRWELDLRLALAPVLMERSGPASDALQDNGERALGSARAPTIRRDASRSSTGSDTSMRCAATRSGSMRRSRRMTDLAERTGRADKRLIMHTVRMRTNVYRARSADACREGELIRAAARTGAGPPEVPFGTDPVIGSLSHHAWSSWMRGEVDRARTIVREMGAAVRKDRPFTRTAAAGTFVCLMRRARSRRAEGVARRRRQPRCWPKNTGSRS